MVKSLLQRNEACYICGTTLNLHRHHIFYGTANRKLSDEDGCVIYLCQRHHTGDMGIHHIRKIDLVIKAKCQLRWQEHINVTKLKLRILEAQLAREWANAGKGDI